MSTSKTVKTSNFSTKLARENKQVKADRANRIGATLEATQTMKILTIEGHIRNLETRLDEMTDVSTDNVSTTLNVLKKGFDGDEFVEEMHDITVKLELRTRHLEVAKKNYEEWFALK